MVKVKTTTNKRQCVDNAWAEEGGKQEERGEGARAIEMAQTDADRRDIMRVDGQHKDIFADSFTSKEEQPRNESRAATKHMDACDSGSRLNARNLGPVRCGVL